MCLYFSLHDPSKGVIPKTLAGMLVLTTMLVLIVGAVSCNCANTNSIKKSIVEVWIPDPATGELELESLGVAVGDGTMVLTVINYEDYSPGDVKVVSSGHELVATIQAIDSRTGATLLKMSTGKLPAAATGDTTTLKAKEKLIVWGQADSYSALTQTDVLVTDVIPHSTLDFNVVLPEDVMNSGGWGGAQSQGAIVTALGGKVLGLESIYNTRLVMRTGYIGYIPPLISINSALELLSPTAISQPWSNGPLLFSANDGSKSGIYDGFVREYLSMATAITPVLSEMGQPLSTSDLPQDFTLYVFTLPSSDGSWLTTVFPRPVDLRDAAGNVLAQAKWLAMQWGRNDGKPSRIVYGNAAYVVEGSFEITGDASSLDNTVRTMVNDQMPYGP